jgi:dTDP-4-amino-4,6-dideoxygalactose transaminase
VKQSTLVDLRKRELYMINFNKPYLTGKEAHYMYDAVYSGKLSGNGKYTHLCHSFFEEHYGFKKCLLTTSCTDALEMASILCDIQPGDEVIVPSFTFVSSANPFVLRGAKLVFADSMLNHPNLDVSYLENLITTRTKVIVPVHYAGTACQMDTIMVLAEKYNLWVVEDAAQAIDSFYIDSFGQKKPLGSIGHLAAFSFHETKNIISGEGGMLTINDSKLINRAEILWEKGTNRSAFFRGEVDKYGWVDIGSSFLPSEIISSFLWAQLENIDIIQKRRKEIWNLYFHELQDWSFENNVLLPDVPTYSTNNAHIFYLVCPSLKFRSRLIEVLKDKGIMAIFHYISLHSSEYYKEKHDGRVLVQSDKYTDTLLRLPLFYELRNSEVIEIVEAIKKFVF